MANHALKNRKAKKKYWRRKVAKFMSAAVVAGGATLLQSLVLATATATAAPTVVFIDGHNYPDSGTRMLGQLTGRYQAPIPCQYCVPLQTPVAGTTSYFVQYPATLGLLDGPGAPTGDQSVAVAQHGLETYLASNPPSATNPTTVVAYSEGAVAGSHEVSHWGPNDNIAFVLIADPERPNGGILSRFPAGTYIPFLGITAGNATPANDAPVVMVTRQYDGVADAPAYPLNVLADANAFLGFYYLHNTYYSVNPNDPNNIVTKSGNMTDILVPAAPGQLPIFMPLAQAGVPQPILVALDPAVRALIETGYNRTSDPAQQVRFGLLPPPSAWPGDVQMVVVGFITTAEELPGAIVASLPGATGLTVLAPLNGIKSLTPVTSPLPVNPAPAKMPVQRTQLVSNVQSAAPVQQNVAANRSTAQEPATGVKTQPVADTSSTTVSPPASPPIQERVPSVPKITNPAFTVCLPSANQASSTPTANPSGSSSNVNKPLQGAISSVTGAVGSLFGNVTHNSPTGASSSQTQSSSTGSSTSH